MEQREVFGLVLQGLILVVVLPEIIGFNIFRRRRLRRTGQPVPRLLTAAMILFIVVGVMDAIGIVVALTGI